MRLSEAVQSAPRIEIHVLGARGAPSTVPGPAGDVAKVTTRVELAAIGGAVAGTTRYLAEPGGRAGMFVFDTSNLSARVTADTAQGIYVAPAAAPSGAAGAWVRAFDGPANVKWWGATGDGVTNDGPAFLAALATLKAMAVNPVATWYQGSVRLRIPPGHYYLGANTLDITHTLIIEGDGSGQSGGFSTKLRWSAGATGIRVQKHNTEGDDDVSAANFQGGDATTIRGLNLVGGYAGAEGEFHGVHLRARAVIEDCFISDFQGDGIYSRAASGGGAGFEGNINNSVINRVTCVRNRRGLYLDSADANACFISMLEVSSNRTWGVEDSSFLGNTYVACHAAANGWDGALGSTPTATVHAGNRYAVKVGQAVGASTNAPSGTTADNTWWLYIGPGAAYTGVVPWVSGTAFREGGAYKTDDVSAANILVGCYSEGDQNPSQLVTPTLTAGGLHGAGIKGSGAAISSDPQGNSLRVVGGVDGGFIARETPAGANYCKHRADGFKWNDHYQLKFFGTDFAWTVAESGVPSNWSFRLNGDATAHPVGARKLVFDNGFGLGEKKVLPGAAAPVAGAYNQGDMVFNSAPVAGGPLGWICTAAGSPGTWKAMANIAA